MFFKSKKNGLAKAAPGSVPQAPAQDGASAVVGNSFDHATQPPLDSQLAAKMLGLDEQPAQGPPPLAPEASGLSEEELRKHAARSKQISAAFGEIVSVFMRMTELKGMTLGALETMVVPAIATGQYLIAGTQSKENGMTASVAAVLWATVSEDVDQRLSSELDKPIKLEPKEWKSGDIPWLICVAGDRRVVDGMLKKLQSDAFKNNPIKMRARGQDGQTTIATIPAG